MDKAVRLSGLGRADAYVVAMHTRTVIASLVALTATLGAGLAIAAPAQAAGAITFSHIQYNSPGSDTRSNSSLNAEYVRLHNNSSKNIAMKGWTVRDAQGHVYTFGTYTLHTGASVTLHTGKGTNTSTNRYWGSGNYIWNNTGDTATLKNSPGTKIDVCKWGDGSGSTNC